VLLNIPPRLLAPPSQAGQISVLAVGLTPVRSKTDITGFTLVHVLLINWM